MRVVESATARSASARALARSPIGSTALARPRGHACQQGDSGRPALQRVATAFVERQLIEDVGRHDHRDGNLLVALGDEQRHRRAELVGEPAQGGQAQLTNVVVERRAQDRER